MLIEELKAWLLREITKSLKEESKCSGFDTEGFKHCLRGENFTEVLNKIAEREKKSKCDHIYTSRCEMNCNGLPGVTCHHPRIAVCINCGK